MESIIKGLFVEHLLSPSLAPAHQAGTKADKTPCPGGADILEGEIQTGNKQTVQCRVMMWRKIKQRREGKGSEPWPHHFGRGPNEGSKSCR